MRRLRSIGYTLSGPTAALLIIFVIATLSQWAVTYDEHNPPTLVEVLRREWLWVRELLRRIA